MGRKKSNMRKKFDEAVRENKEKKSSFLNEEVKMVVGTKSPKAICNFCEGGKPNGYFNEIINGKKVGVRSYFCIINKVKVSKIVKCNCYSKIAIVQ